MRLIDAEVLVRRAIERYKKAMGTSVGHGMGVITSMITDAPTIDAEIRVRCEDCVSSGGDRFGELICQNQLCPCYGREVDHAFSCILGERREENAAD